MSDPKISVVTAVYNGEATIGHAIASVAAQTYPDLEHIIVDGNSSDDTLRVVEQARHDRMRVISEPDKGIYDALNKGIALATGDIVGFLHSDDFLAHDQAIGKYATPFRDQQVEAVFSDLHYVSRENGDHVIRHWATGPFNPRRLRRGWMPAHPTLFLRREVYENFGVYDTGFRIAADYDFILRYFSKIEGRTVYIPEVLYKMRVGGVSNRDIARILEKSREDLRALRRNGVGGVPTLAWKNLSKIGQFRRRRRP